MIIRAMIVAFCLGVIIQATVLLRQEVRVIYLLTGTTNDQIDIFADASNRPVVASSARTLRDLLNTCAKLKVLAPRLKAQRDTGQVVQARCEAMALQVIRRAPANARARALAVLMAPSLTAADLAAAQRAAPYEPWPLSTRLSAIGATAALGQDLQTLAKADFSRALQSDWGRREMAKLYMQRADLRPLVQDALAPLAPQDQADFIRLTRAALRNQS